MDRKAISFLKHWFESKDRKPLVIRGPRQVGKTWLVRSFSNSNHLDLIELNLEKRPEFTSLFKSNNPKEIILNIEAFFTKKLDLKSSLLFIDEIQAAPELLAKLRWFAEELPELPVIAAGSLLEFALADHTFSMPVGRINYLYLEPLSFEEYLLARDQKMLHQYLFEYQLSNDIPILIHNQFTHFFKEYLIIGGMPAAVASWNEHQSLSQVNQMHHDLLATFRDDFSKYSGRIQVQNLNTVMMAVPKMLGQKFVYSHVNPDIPIQTTKQALTLLNQARICHKITSSAANGIPLGAEIREKHFKEIFLDTGLVGTALGLNLNFVKEAQEIILINNGGVAEQVAGQIIRTINPFYVEPILYYWNRDEPGSNAEIDYVIAHGNKVIPIEIKAGSTGSLKSLHLFMELKKYDLAVRVNSDLPSKTRISVKSRNNANISYDLLSIPFYLLGQLHRLLDHAYKN